MMQTHALLTRTLRAGGRLLIVMTLALSQVACSGRGAGERVGATATAAPRVGYPRGLFWREPDKLARLVVAFSHIVIAHEGVRVTPDPVGLWMPVRRTTRSRVEALRVAGALALRLRAHPEEFEATAMRISDDEASAPLGGELGVAHALRYPAPLLDALATLAAGDVSRVVETEFGLHILRRHAVDREPKLYSARRITIAYQGVRPEGVAAGRGDRTRTQAKELARKLRAELKQSTSRLAAVLEQSDSLDGAFGGDWGAWSEREVGVEPLVIAALRRVPIGGLTEVIDTRWGYQFFVRDDRTSRDRLAADVLAIGHNEMPAFLLAHPVSRSKKQARALAEELAPRVSLESFGAMQRKYCDAAICSPAPVAWSQGHMHPQIETVVQGLEIGAVSKLPMDTRFGYLLVRRLDPANVAAPSALASAEFEFPSSEPWKLEQYVHNLAPDRLALFTRQFGRDAAQALDLTDSQRSGLATLIGSLATVVEHAEAKEREALFAQTEAEAAELLGARRFAELLRYRERWFEHMSKL